MNNISFCFDDALLWALHSFKCRAMTITHDQLKDEVDAIKGGQARVSHRGSQPILIYAQDETEANCRNLRLGPFDKTKAY